MKLNRNKFKIPFIFALSTMFSTLTFAASFCIWVEGTKSGSELDHIIDTGGLGGGMSEISGYFGGAIPLSANGDHPMADTAGNCISYPRSCNNLRRGCDDNSVLPPSDICDNRQDRVNHTYTKYFKRCSGPCDWLEVANGRYTCPEIPNNDHSCPIQGTIWNDEQQKCIGENTAFQFGLDGDLDQAAQTAQMATQGMANASGNYSIAAGIDPNLHNAAATEGGMKVASASKDKGAPITSRVNATTSDGKKSTSGSGSGGSGGGFLGALGNLFGSSDLKPETDAGEGMSSPNVLAAVDGENGSIYGSGKKASGSAKKSTDSYASVLAGDGKGIEFGRDPASSNVNPMGSDDPANYFARIGLEESIFKRVSTRYNETTTQWARVDLSKDRLPASKKALDAAKDPTELLKTSIK